MGHVSEDILNGEICALCMATFIDFNEGETELKIEDDKVINATVYEHGYPVACDECWDEECGYQKALKPTA
jgi:hypothetical protein